MIPHLFSHTIAAWLVSFAFVSLAPLGSALPSDPNAIEYVELDPLAIAAARSTAGPGARVCNRLAVRREWRDLTTSNKLDFIRATKCLQNTRSNNHTLPPKFTRYDDFVYCHINIAEQVHLVGQFLAWHRHFDFLFEKDLRQRCNYSGPFPYWDWTRDADGNVPLAQSPLFDPVTGFGGDGVPGTYSPPTDDDGSAYPLVLEPFKGCVQTGPFADTTFHHGPNLRFTDHCLTRGITDAFRAALTSPNVANILSQSTFLEFWRAMDGEVPDLLNPKLHGSGHISIGGDFISFYSSPNDPLFYLHHAGLDRLWWTWQKADLANRLYQIGGRVRTTPPFEEVTVNYEMPFAGLSPPVTLRKAMDLRVEPYCYTYPN